MKNILAFDMDGTLTPSREVISFEMLEELKRLSKKYHLAILTGGSIDLVKKQILQHIDFNCKIYIWTMSGSKFYIYQREQKWWWFNAFVQLQEGLSYKIPWVDKRKIYTALYNLIDLENLKPLTDVEDMVEDRGSQITFSAIGRNAPKQNKDNYDPDRKKRKKLAVILNNSFIFLGLNKDYQILIGGTTSIDIIPNKFSKGKALKTLSKYFDTEAIYYGDKLQKGGNDYSVRQERIKCVEVKDESDCLEKLRRIQ